MSKVVDFTDDKSGLRVVITPDKGATVYFHNAVVCICRYGMSANGLLALAKTITDTLGKDT